MRGIVQCMKCYHHQPWKAQDRWKGPRAASYCRKCGVRNRFRPHLHQGDGTRRRGHRHGRQVALFFYRRPDHDPMTAITLEANARNIRTKEGVFVNVDEEMVRQAERLRERVRKRIAEMEEFESGIRNIFGEDDEPPSST